ncbi:PAS domain S-box protein [Laspinema olomoucense]|uniref:PAS domain S-box protein n=1 Tax=Laspinema olomoucense TaxID=3231600 RepID=UPI0021BB6B37|nr:MULTISPECIES: PAS domain S-box protein [unclassified Laspinema]MCT7990832.1 PAS domain S-box protein [Laspinema sp. D3a]MCT7993003.1 PAS domain S-box protein [Laspinema sp. D3c]
MSNPLENLELGSRDLAVVIKELRATLGKMELALGSIDEAIVWTGEDGLIQWCNTTFDRLVNRSHLSVLGCPLSTLVPLTQGGIPLLETEYPVEQVLSQKFEKGEYEFHQGGSLLILEIAGSFVELKNGDRTAVLTIRDVTERKAMEEALISANREMSIYFQEVDRVIQAAISVENNSFQPQSLDVVASRPDELGRLARVFTQMVLQLKAREQELAEAKEQLEAVLNAVPGSISWVDSGGLFVGVNRHLAENFNLSQEAFIGREVGFLQENAKLASFLGEFISSKEAAASCILDFNINEEQRHYLIACQKYQQGSATVSVGIDITDRKRAEESLRIAEENYRSIFENALEGIFQSSPEGRFITVNPALAKIYGYDSPNEMIESITNIGGQLYVDAEKRSEFKELAKQQGAVKNFQYRSYCKDGRIIWIQIDARIVKDSSGKTLYYEGIVQDITEQKRREEQLKQQLAELKIEIDHQKREKDVAMLTESSYFQEVKQEMSEVNLDEFWG